jgi:hypothetical protein
VGHGRVDPNSIHAVVGAVRFDGRQHHLGQNKAKTVRQRHRLTPGKHEGRSEDCQNNSFQKATQKSRQLKTLQTPSKLMPAKCAQNSCQLNTLKLVNLLKCNKGRARFAFRLSPLEPNDQCNFMATGLEANQLELARAKWTLKFQAFWASAQSARARAICNFACLDQHPLSLPIRARSSQTHM